VLVVLGLIFLSKLYLEFPRPLVRDESSVGEEIFQLLSLGDVCQRYNFVVDTFKATMASVCLSLAL
jgi:hypothetical protein